MMDRKKAYWKDKNVFVTGATGFVGSWLTKALVENGASVVCLIRDVVPRSFLFSTGTINKVNIVYGCLEDYMTVERILNEYEIDTCFHLAAQSIVGVANRSPISTFKSNIMGTWNILEACRHSKSIRRVVIASSDKAYGTHNQLPYKEDYKLLGLHPYDVSKSCADILSQTYYHAYKLPVGISRCANIYGGGDLNFNRIIPETIRSVINDKNPIIRSDGTYIRDYLYIQDAVESYLTLAKHLKDPSISGQAFNFGSEKPISVLDLVNKIIDISGKTNLKPEILNIAKGEIERQYLSCGKARELLGWKASITLEEGLERTYLWFKNFLIDRI